MKIKQVKGLAVIEFTIMSSFFLLLIFSILSIGMLMFSMQAVSEATRTAARMAAVCQIGDAGVKDYVSTNSLVSMVGVDNIQIEYLDENSSVLATPTINNVRFVRARAVGLNYQLMSLLGFLGTNGLITIPSFETTIPSESLGIVTVASESDTDC
ncbi:pilus biosynthesis protein TadE (plasmid) [Vibrio rotiferianus]|uniref:Pilus biosynthesis protein TadE n=1 Tax=Vibrio rotiferianus TaxID=190895 RepID=A0A510IJ53_9VIBR|nr:TadE/TadG family type IV pilus assembly protein [Vibrio rotiferianus]BBL92446.1 pilus biosynthesis protein TadE [Vibrio rotiferianus]